MDNNLPDLIIKDKHYKVEHHDGNFYFDGVILSDFTKTFDFTELIDVMLYCSRGILKELQRINNE